jgi:DNA invertase Pin-like site-specific DNA recombinase
MKIAIYARVSTSDQTCEQQLHELRTYVSQRGWPTATEYVDTISGSKDSRPALNRLLADSRSRKVDCIVVTKLDRWGRSMSHLVASIQELEALGVRFIAPSQGIDTDHSNPTSKLMLNLLASFAEFERGLIIERTKAGQARARREGKVFGRPKLIINRQEILDLRAAGMKIKAIALRMECSVGFVAKVIAA